MQRAVGVGFGCALALWVLASGTAEAWTPFFVRGYCQTSKGHCTATVGNRGGASGCCDPSSPQIASCAQTNACVGTYALHWAKLPVLWKLNLNNMAGKAGFAGLSEAALEKEARRAWDAWSAPACTSFRHSYSGKTTAAPDYFDGQITLFLATEALWAQLGSSRTALAFAAPRYDSQGRMLDGDIIFNPKPGGIRWGTPPVAKDAYDFTMAMSHEVGHSLGFGHSPLQAALMFFASKGPGASFTGLDADDRAAVCHTYPQRNTCANNDACGPCMTCQNNACGPANPKAARTCGACQTDADCQGGTCLQTAEGNRCIQPCKNKCCPTGYRCLALGGKDLCVPLRSQCDAIPCTSAAACGRGGTCDAITKRCASSSYDPTLCAKACTSDAQCGGIPNRCVEVGGGLKRCVSPCASGYFCPTGYVCRATPSGSFCVPHDPFFCPCRSTTDCGSVLVCKNGLCQAIRGGNRGDFCNSNAPCSSGLECLTLNGGNKCVQTCTKAKCPAGQSCKNFSINRQICVGQPTVEPGGSCDNFLNYCKPGLSCMATSQGALSGTCVERCSGASATCTQGGVCVASPAVGSYCGCKSDADCVQGFVCTDIAGGLKVCSCAKPPCKTSCGDGLCGSGESCGSCPKDCPCKAGTSCQNGACKASPCGDGVCDPTENCQSCPADCPCPSGEQCIAGGTCKKAQLCGDGVCDTSQMESCASCPTDCPCPAGQTCTSGATCQPTSTQTCGDGTCDAAKGESCSTCAKDCPCRQGFACLSGQCQRAPSCGDGACDVQKEDCQSCPADCPCPTGHSCQAGQCSANPQPSCGNGACDPNENCANCPPDCTCAAGTTCQGTTCQTSTPPTKGSCGDGVCSLSEGENCSTCKPDCGCKNRTLCHWGACVSPNLLCPPAYQSLQCDASGANCVLNCARVSGCGCSTAPRGATPMPFALLLLLALWGVRRLIR